MILEILPNGVGSEPIVIDATLVVARHNDGTPVMVAGSYGPQNTIRASHANDADFNSTLQKLGFRQGTICDVLELPQAPTGGARLIKGQ